MKKRPSYSDLMKASAMKRDDETDPVNIYVEMLLDEILFNSKAEKLGNEIDRALDNRDYPSFQRLSGEYKQLMQHAN
jgi:uncharacterized protein YpiB (UPF0302 family)